MKIKLENVTFGEKDTVKSLGAKWNPVEKYWYIENVEDLIPFADWIPSIAGFYNLSKSSETKIKITKVTKERKPSKRLSEKEWESKRISDIKKRPKEYSFLNSDGLVQCKNHIFKLGDDVEVYHFGLWRIAKITTDGTRLLTSIGTEAINQRIRPLCKNKAKRIKN